MGTLIKMMTLTFGFVAIIRTCATAADPDRDEKATENLIRSVLNKLCPGADVCLDNKTTPAVPNEDSCCTECSCEEDCDDVGNCCFMLKKSARERTFEGECLFPTVPQPVGQNRIYHQSYRMIADVPRYDESGNKIFDKCGDEMIATWGSLFPVFSQRTKKIYKNMACADAANVTDGETWDVFLACDHSHEASSLIFDFNFDIVPDGCEVRFKYPRDKSDLTSLICFENLIDSCGGNYYSVPNVLPFSKEDVSNACSSGFISPFRQKDMYANIFCHICNAEGFISQKSCKHVTNVRGPNVGKGFVSVLDSRLMTKEFHKSVKQLNAPLACSNPTDNEGFDHCRSVYCPLGQIRNERGKCIFMMKNLYMQKCSIFVKLTANVSFSINDTFNRSVWVVYTDVSHLSHKWPNNWVISMVFYENKNKTSDMTNSLIVEMLNESPVNDPRALLTNIKAYLQKQWTLKLVDDTLIAMSADLSKDLSRISTVWENATFPVYDALFILGQIERGNPFPITRLYFCEQVELSSHEFELHDGVLFNKITNKPHFPGEYSSSAVANGNVRHRVRICIQNSGFRKRDRTHSVNGSGIVPVRALENKSFCLFVVLFLIEFIIFH